MWPKLAGKKVPSWIGDERHLVGLAGDRIEVEFVPRPVEPEIEDAERYLTQLEQTHVQVARCHQPSHQIGRDGLVRLVVAGKPLQDLWFPAPVLHDLRWGFDEVLLGAAPRETDQLGPGQGLVKDVAELVEQRHHLVVLEQRGPLRGWFGQVGDDR